MMKVSEYVAEWLVEAGIRDVFLVSGGGIMHLLDAIGTHPQLRYFSHYHEQAAVVAAEGYARRTGRPACVLVTVGPGAANAVAGLPGSWVDSVPLLVLAGQVRQDIIADYRVARQFGPQEANTLDMARPVTKYAQRVREPRRVRAELALALHHATQGRPGPAWLEFPLDVQGATIDPAVLEEPDLPPRTDLAGPALADDVERVAEVLAAAERPLIVPGNGVRLAGAEALLDELLAVTAIPAAVAFTAKDLLPEDHPQNAGLFGTAGQRRGNFAVQQCTALLTLGAGLNVQKVGFNFAGFAPHATKIIVDVDEQQLRYQAVRPDIAVHSDVRPFLRALIDRLRGARLACAPRWLAAIAGWRVRYPLITDDYRSDPAHVNPYLFMDELSRVTRSTDTIVVGAGIDAVSCYQAFRVRAGQRVLITGWGSMGWDIPLAIGASAAAGRTIIVAGDGSVQWNIQELMTIRRYALPVKLVVFNNRGFGNIRATQNAFFAGRYVGADEPSGVSNPDFAQLAAAYGLTYARIDDEAALAPGLASFLADAEPGLCEVNVAFDVPISPKASSFRRADGTFESRPLEDMAPFLPREEVAENLALFASEDART